MRNDVAELLREHAMPPEEIQAIVTTDDRRVVRRYLELHRERLEERLAEQRERLAALERSLIEAIDERRWVA